MGFVNKSLINVVPRFLFECVSYSVLTILVNLKFYLFINLNEKNSLLRYKKRTNNIITTISINERKRRRNFSLHC